MSEILHYWTCGEIYCGASAPNESTTDPKVVTCQACLTKIRHVAPELVRESELPHPTIYPTIGMKIGDLVAQKRIHYGDSFNRSHEIIEVLFPDGVPQESYQDLLTIIRIVDKLFRIANRHKAREAGMPDTELPEQDVFGYLLLAIVREEQTLPSKPKKEHDTNNASI